MNEFDDPFGMLRHSRPSGLRTENGEEIRFVGQTILALDPRTNDLYGLSAYLDHPLLDGRYYYTLPRDVLEAVTSTVGVQSFDPELLEMERELSRVCGDHVTAVGVWQRSALSFSGLRPQGIGQWSDEAIRAVGMEPLAARHGLRVYEDRDLTPLLRSFRGYLGWLLTEQRFLDEHDMLLAEHAAVVNRWGTARAAFVVPQRMQDQMADGTNPEEDPQWPAFTTACRRFFIRWRLQGLAGPYLPVPLSPLMAGSFPLSIVRQLMETGGVFYLPETMAIPSREQLRGLLVDSLHRGADSQHLDEWLHIIRAANPARTQMDRFARLFEIQHYWRILHARHQAALNGNTGKIEAALGQVFDISTETIHADLIKIRDRLGGAWLDREWPV